MVYSVLMAVRRRSGIAQLFVESRDELLSQFNHFAGVFFVLHSTRQVAPIVSIAEAWHR
jgi:hypothetical protein